MSMWLSQFSSYLVVDGEVILEGFIGVHNLTRHASFACKVSSKGSDDLVKAFEYIYASRSDV